MLRMWLNVLAFEDARRGTAVVFCRGFVAQNHQTFEVSFCACVDPSQRTKFKACPRQQTAAVLGYGVPLPRSVLRLAYACVQRRSSRS